MVKSTVALVVFIILTGSILSGFAVAEKLSLKVANRTESVLRESR